MVGGCWVFLILPDLGFRENLCIAELLVDGTPYDQDEGSGEEAHPMSVDHLGEKAEEKGLQHHLRHHSSVSESMMWVEQDGRSLVLDGTLD